MQWALESNAASYVLLPTFLLCMVAATYLLSSGGQESWRGHSAPLVLDFDGIDDNLTRRAPSEASSSAACPAHGVTLAKDPCHVCACKFVEPHLKRPPGALSCREAKHCDGDAVPYCFQELNMTWSAIQRYDDLEQSSALSSNDQREAREDWVTRPRRRCINKRVLLIGDSHAAMRAQQMNRIYHRKVIVAWSVNFTSEWADVLHLLDKKVVCMGDVLVLAVDTTKWGVEQYTALGDAVVEFMKQHVLRLLWFPESWSFQDSLPPRCTDGSEGFPSSCALSTAKVRADCSAISGPVVEKYREDGRITFIHDTDHRCTDQYCDLWIPHSRTPGYIDNEHTNLLMSRYLEPFYCSELQRVGAL